MVSGGSHHRYSDEVRNLVLVQLAAGIRPSEIASNLGVSKPFVSQVKTRGAVDPEILKRAQLPKGRPPKLAPHALQGLKDYIREHPEANRTEIHKVLQDQFGVEIHLTTVGRIVKKLKTAGDSSDASTTASMSTSPPTIVAQTSASRRALHINTPSIQSTPDRPKRKHRKRNTDQTID